MFHDYFVNSPMLTYYPNDEVDGDYTTWYAPNPAYIQSFLKTEGFNKFDTKRIYSFLTERYMPFWFEKYSKIKFGPWIFFDTEI